MRAEAITNTAGLSSNLPDELRDSLFHGFGDQKDLAVLWFEHTFCDAVIEETDELVVEAVDVEQYDRLGVDFEGMPREDFEEFFKGAEATRKSDEGIGSFSDERLASVHGVGDVKLSKAVMSYFKINQNLWNDSNDFAVGDKRGFGDGQH